MKTEDIKYSLKELILFIVECIHDITVDFRKAETTCEYENAVFNLVGFIIVAIVLMVCITLPILLIINLLINHFTVTVIVVFLGWSFIKNFKTMVGKLENITKRIIKKLEE